MNPKADECWYDARAVGHNILAGTVRRLCKEAGLDGYFTNHSLKATTATRLFEAGVDKQLIILRTGHLTTSGVRSHKCVGEKQKSINSHMLNGSKTFKKDTDYQEHSKHCTLHLEGAEASQEQLSLMTM